MKEMFLPPLDLLDVNDLHMHIVMKQCLLASYIKWTQPLFCYLLTRFIIINEKLSK